MKNTEIKVGSKVKAIFRKCGKRMMIGEVWKISTNEDELPGTWVSIRVTGGDMRDWAVAFMAKNRHNILVPIVDVVEVIE